LVLREAKRDLAHNTKPVTTGKPSCKISLGSSEFEQKLCEILNGRNIAQRLLTCDLWNWTLNEGKP
jgi:hypothetical protein